MTFRLRFHHQFHNSIVNNLTNKQTIPVRAQEFEKPLEWIKYLNGRRSVMYINWAPHMLRKKSRHGFNIRQEPVERGENF